MRRALEPARGGPARSRIGAAQSEGSVKGLAGPVKVTGLQVAVKKRRELRLRQRADLLRVRPGRPCTGSPSGCRGCRTCRAWPGLASMSSLATVSLPSYSLAMSSSTGANILHGPHHSAQKSTSTGVADLQDVLVERRVGNVLDHAQLIECFPSHAWFRARRAALQSRQLCGRVYRNLAPPRLRPQTMGSDLLKFNRL